MAFALGAKLTTGNTDVLLAMFMRGGLVTQWPAVLWCQCRHFWAILGARKKSGSGSSLVD